MKRLPVPTTRTPANQRRVVALAVAITATMATSITAAWTTPAHADTGAVAATINVPAGTSAALKASPGSSSATLGTIDSSQQYSVLCYRPASGGDPWDLITTPGGSADGIGYVPGTWVTIPGQASVIACGNQGLNLGDSGDEEARQQCAAAIAAAEDAASQEASDKIFYEFMKNYIENNGERWSAALAAHGDNKAPAPASSAAVSDAVGNFEKSASDVVDSTVEAFKKIADKGVNVPQVDCTNRSQDEIDQEVKDDRFKLLAEEEANEDWLGKALDKIAGGVAEWARDHVSSDGSYQPPDSTSTSR